MPIYPSLHGSLYSARASAIAPPSAAPLRPRPPRGSPPSTRRTLYLHAGRTARLQPRDHRDRSAPALSRGGGSYQGTSPARRGHAAAAYRGAGGALTSARAGLAVARPSALQPEVPWFSYHAEGCVRGAWGKESRGPIRLAAAAGGALRAGGLPGGRGRAQPRGGVDGGVRRVGPAAYCKFTGLIAFCEVVKLWPRIASPTL
jgi:hypothetical protein